MSARARIRLLTLCGLVLLIGAALAPPSTAQGNRKEVRPKQAVRDADPSFAPLVEPGTSFTYRVSLKQGRRFVTSNGDGVEVTQTQGNIAVAAMRRVSNTIYEVDFTSSATGGAGSAAVRINLTNSKGKLKFVRSAVTVARETGDELVRISTVDKFIVDRVGVGSQPMGIGTLGTPVTNFLYALTCNTAADTLTIVDLRDDSRVGTIPVGDQPAYVAIAGQFGAQFGYVTNAGDDSVTVVDLQSFTPIGTIGVGDTPQGITLTGQAGVRQLAWVANRESDTVSVIDTISNTVVQTIPVGDGPMGIAASGRLGAQVVVVTLANANAIALVDANSGVVLGTVPVGARPVFVAVGGAQNTEIFVVNQGSSSVSFLDLDSQIELARIPVGPQPLGAIVAGPTNASEVYVANRGDGTVTVIDVSSRSAIFTLPIGGRPRGVEVIGTIGQQEIIVTN
jgi:YVTN family beta-propeller protein